MVDAIPHQQVGTCNRSPVNGFGGLWPLVIALVMLMMSYGLLTNGAQAADRSRPIRIGVLSTSWGPTPATAGLRDGLLELGYHEREDYVLGIRFTKGILRSCPAQRANWSNMELT